MDKKEIELDIFDMSQEQWNKVIKENLPKILEKREREGFYFDRFYTL